MSLKINHSGSYLMVLVVVLLRFGVEQLIGKWFDFDFTTLNCKWLNYNRFINQSL